MIKRRYGLGAEFFRLANVVARKASVSSLVQPILDELVRETGETAPFATYQPAQRGVAYVAKSDSPHSLRFRIDLFQPVSPEWAPPASPSWLSCPRKSRPPPSHSRGPRQ